MPVEKPRRRRASTKADAAVARVEAAPTLEQAPEIAAEQAVADVAQAAPKPRRTRRTAATTDGNIAPTVEQAVVARVGVQAAEAAKQVAETGSNVVKAEKRKRVKATASDDTAPTVEQIAESSVNESVAEIVEPIAEPAPEVAIKPEKRKRVKATRSAVEAQAATVAPAEPEEQPKPAQKRPRKARPAADEPKPDTAMLMPVRNGQREIPAGPMFLMSYDDSPKRTFHEKVEAAMQAYQTRFARRPNLVLVNANVAPEMVVEDVSIERRVNRAAQQLLGGYAASRPGYCFGINDQLLSRRIFKAQVK